MNTVCIGGRIVSDPKLKIGKNENKVAVTSIAVYGGKDLKGNVMTWFFLVQGFGQAADFLCKYRKGNRIFIEGYLTQSKWTDKNGQRRDSVGIVIRNINTTDKVYEPEEVIEKPGATTTILEQANTEGLELPEDDYPW